MPQKNANHYARGENHGESLPPYDAKRILAHYLTSIGFVGLNPDPPNDYRFNILRFGGMDDRADNPLIFRTGQTYPFSFIVQNTGDNDWSLNCYDDHPWHDTALSYHWYSYPNKQYLSPQYPYFEGARTALCGPNDSGTLAPGREYPDQSQSSATAYASVNVNVLPGQYWLRLDMEFFSAYKWGSRLHPQDNQTNAHWPTQDIRVQVIVSQPPEPDPGLASGQTPGVWNSNSTVQLTWAAVNDPLVTHYRVCCDKRNDGQGATCSNGSSPYTRTLADGIYDFEVTAIASDGKHSSPGTVDNVRLDATLPTAYLNPLPVRIQAPDYVLAWSVADTGGSGLHQQQLTYQINNDDNWRSVSAVKEDVNMRSIRFYFPEGQHGDVYEFCLRSLDGAGSWSAPSCRTTTYNPDPELYVDPLQITVFRVYSDTTPTLRTIRIENHGGDTLNWTATTPFTLAVVSPAAGPAPADVTLTLTHPVGITATYVGRLTVTATTPGSHNSPQQVRVEVRVVDRIYIYYMPLLFKQ